MRMIAAALLVLTAAAVPACAQHLPPFGGPAPAPSNFTATLSNNAPLVFGMDVEETSRALGTPLIYVSGRRGNEIYLTFRDIGGSGLFPHKDRLFLQFRKGRLAGWKADWGQNWMWR
ncbi:hypothetical protein I6F35_34100 [Bradyrhizobium sp. BRP22]|uniref:hypothetical protein n=1 Tax=Bradyrhizobium sp. BRP22 TaxID=2793821 RepID=UPI001CD5BE09|nr:hypothetical protein [Bradyrhizobium sp. BRP22]MCA1458168.1 hypothetical protein [Bradyrhizobium sp. BRP22]